MSFEIIGEITETELIAAGSSIHVFAVCVNNSEYPVSLELHKIYQALPDEDAAIDGDVRIIDESGEDYLYPAKWFVFVELSKEAEQSLLQAADHPVLGCFFAI